MHTVSSSALELKRTRRPFVVKSLHLFVYSQWNLVTRFAYSVRAEPHVTMVNWSHDRTDQSLHHSASLVGGGAGWLL